MIELDMIVGQNNIFKMLKRTPKDVANNDELNQQLPTQKAVKQLSEDMFADQFTDHDQKNYQQDFCVKYHQLLDFIGLTYSKKLEVDSKFYQTSANQSEQQNNCWLPLSESTYLKNTLGYYGQAWLNHTTKQIVIVSAGTKIELPSLSEGSLEEVIIWLITMAKNSFNILQDIINDALIYAKYLPYQFENGSSRFVDDTIAELQQKVNLSEYNICFTGHSLGGVLSELTLTYVMNEYPNIFREIRSVSFDNPGSKPLVERYLALLPVHEQNNIATIDEVKNSCITFNHKANWLNSLHAQTGQIYSVIAGTKIQSTGFFSKIFLIGEFLNTINHHDKVNFRQAQSFTKEDDWQEGMFDKYIFDSGNAAIQIFLGLPNIVGNLIAELNLPDFDETIELFCLGLQNNFCIVAEVN